MGFRYNSRSDSCASIFTDGKLLAINHNHFLQQRQSYICMFARYYHLISVNCKITHIY